VGNPEREFPSIHVAGTNGKGSTATFLASVFVEGGYKTALYTSPHLVNFTERIRINGQVIAEARLVEYAQRLRPMIEEVQATFFEATTCIAFQYFADDGVAIAIIEAGLGGRLDSTNVLRPLVSVITNVSFDHMEYLGDTLTKIAGEKGGIIRRGVPCVTASMKKEVVETLRRITKRKATRLIQANKRAELRTVDSKDDRYVVNLRAKRISITGAKLGLSGVHQAINAATAVAAVDVLMSKRVNVKLFPRLNNKAVRRGLENVVENTGFHGRLEPFGKKILLDVAHNREGIETLAASLSPRARRNLIVVFGVMKDKDYRAMCEIVAGMAKHVVAVQAKNDRALKSSEIAKRINLIGENATNGRSVCRGVEIAMKLAGKKRKVLITGSHYVVGEALEFLQSR
ncbi:MAG: folylpolyglutamate synthase/dihydrofolate synthase family protein, partial [Bacteroidota bacterium]